jgi:hypothetical protein
MALHYSGVPGVPEGWNLVRVGTPAEGEWYLSNTGPELSPPGRMYINTNPYVILLPPSDWVPATRHTKFPAQCRVRDQKTEAWREVVVVRYDRDRTHRWIDETGHRWRYCCVKRGSEDAT